MRKKYFTVEQTHLVLLKEVSIDWLDIEFGAPGVCPKKPYGNSNPREQIAEIIGLDLFIDDEGEGHLSQVQAAMCERYHRDLKEALEILVSNLSIEVGRYECDMYGDKWKKCDSE